MATQDPIIPKPFDALADLADSYDVLAALSSEHDPAWVLLLNLNRQLRAFVDDADNRGLVS